MNMTDLLSDIDVHHAPRSVSDRIAWGFVKSLRFCADTFFAKRYGHRAVVLETVAANMPLIATRVGGIPEIFGRYADKLVTPGNVEELAAAMATAYQDPEAMRRRADGQRKCLSETFNVDLMNDRITSLYLETRGHKRPDKAGRSNEAPSLVSGRVLAKTEASSPRGRE